MTVHLNRVGHNVPDAPGTGDLVLGSVPDGFLSALAAGAVDGGVYEFVVETADGLVFETFLGTYRTAGPSIERTTVRITSNGGTGNLNLPAGCVVYSNISSESVDTDTSASAAAAAASAVAAAASEAALAAAVIATAADVVSTAASAAAAAASASAASTSETNARTSEGVAAAAAIAAASSETDAQTAQAAAEAAQTAAETAQGAAETAETNAGASATAAAASASAASSSETAAASSETDAQTAQTAAEVAQAAAEAAQAAAEATTPLTTKGDIYGYSTLAARLGIGTDTHVLTADNAQPLGIKWAAQTGGLADIIDDATPQLGGALDVNGQKIVSVTNGDIDIEPHGTGNVLLGNLTFDADQTVGAGQDAYVLQYLNSTGLIALAAASGGSGGLTYGGTAAVVSNQILVTGVPAAVTELVIVYEGMSGSANNTHMSLRLGDSGGIEATSYSGVSGRNNPAGGKARGSEDENEIDLMGGDSTSNAGNNLIMFRINVLRIEPGANRWIVTHHGSNPDAEDVYSGAAVKTLSAELTQFALIATISGNIDAGNCYWYYR